MLLVLYLRFHACHFRRRIPSNSTFKNEKSDVVAKASYYVRFDLLFASTWDSFSLLATPTFPMRVLLALYLQFRCCHFRPRIPSNSIPKNEKSEVVAQAGYYVRFDLLSAFT